MIVLPSTGREPDRVDIAGWRFAWKDGRGQPAAVRFRGDDRAVLPLYALESELREAYAEAGVEFDRVRVVSDPAAFVASFVPAIRGGRFRLLVHRGKGADGRRRYVELVP